ncbi:YfjI family protein [Pseudomonas spirodelae]|uniref:YfjI family protein n=1 Tax=Pseudomonas spirodelae TaxID=3101751 RepID=A0ABU5P7T2_9PSED|nr:YfjI family protein [Pseudomonas sp. T5W1]MEA1605721.1 YfjI family protein [Pseudomonas sp. T5W1]
MNYTDDEKTESSDVAPLTNLEGWPSFREHSLFEAAVTEAARELQVSREMAMMCAFGAMATACQKHVDVEMPPGHTSPTSLMLLTIADSGERKTTTQNNFFEAINHLNDAAHRANEDALLEHRVEYQLWSTRKRHLERMYSRYAAQEDETATQASLKEIAEHVRAEPQPVRSAKFLYEDTTPQALVQMLYENAPNGCLLTSEASSIFSGKALGELDKLNTLWDGNSVIVDRISREGFVLQKARLTLSLMAQPSVISRFMGKRGEEARGTGFLARFLVVKPRAMAGQRTDQKLTELPRRKAFNTRIRERLESAVLPERQLLSFSEQAKDLWFQYSRYLEKQMQENGLYHYLKDHASKLLENTSRLAAILHTFERHSDSDTEIDYVTLEFCWKFSQNCSSHFIKNLASEPQIVTDANLLAHYLLTTAYDDDPLKNRNKGETALTDLMSGAATRLSLTKIKQYGPSTLRGRANSERLDAAIELLRKLGHIAREGRFYRFSESILLKEGEPELKNGQIITIKELPLFSEQVYERQGNTSNGSWGTTRYYIKVR